jgi:hypothetical protein
MTEPSDAKPKRATKPSPPKTAPDSAKATKHKKWVKEIEAAQLTRLLRRGEAEVAKALKKVGISYTIEELRVKAPSPVNRDVVLYKRDGKLVGFAVGATPPRPRKPAAPKPAAKKTP